MDLSPQSAKADAALSELRHKLMNKLAVIMALAEMAERDAAKYPKLARAVLENGALMRSDLIACCDRLEETLRRSSAAGDAQQRE